MRNLLEILGFTTSIPIPQLGMDYPMWEREAKKLVKKSSVITYYPPEERTLLLENPENKPPTIIVKCENRCFVFDLKLRPPGHSPLPSAFRYADYMYVGELPSLDKLLPTLSKKMKSPELLVADIAARMHNALLNLKKCLVNPVFYSIYTSTDSQDILNYFPKHVYDFTYIKPAEVTSVKAEVETVKSLLTPMFDISTPFLYGPPQYPEVIASELQLQKQS